MFLKNLSNLLYMVKFKKKLIDIIYSYIFAFNESRKNKTIIYSPSSQKTIVVKYIIDISLVSKTNSFIIVRDYSGTLKLSYSMKRSKKKNLKISNHFLTLNHFLHILNSKAKFLKNQPIILILNNVKTHKKRFIKRLKKKFFIIMLQNFYRFPYNGCRKKKQKRLKRIKK